jgi:hypothetical protein
MKRKATDLLQTIPEIQILNVATDSDADDINNEGERKNIQFTPRNSTNIPIESNQYSMSINAKPINFVAEEEHLTVDDDSSDMMVDNEASIPRLQQMEEDPTYDSCNLTKKWKQITSKERATHAVCFSLIIVTIQK